MATNTNTDTIPPRRVRIYDRYTTPSVGALILTYALALIFIWFGCFKFTQYEAAGIAPLVMNNPFTAWLHSTFGIAGTARVIGVYEILTGILLALRPIQPRLAAIGGAMGVICFLTTLSFLLFTPGVVQPGFTNPLALSAFPGQFLLKDVVLLAASLSILFGARHEARAEQ